jgi:DNA-directed RNA polymerase specialized sigma24 family protein
MSPTAFIQQTIRAAQSGEESAWSILYQHYHPKLYATAICICGALPEVKDLVQDSFMTAYLKLPQLKDPAHFGSWIKKILERNCYRLLSKNRLKKEVDLLALRDLNEAEASIEQKFDRVLWQKNQGMK